MSFYDDSNDTVSASIFSKIVLDIWFCLLVVCYEHNIGVSCLSGVLLNNFEEKLFIYKLFEERLPFGSNDYFLVLNLNYDSFLVFCLLLFSYFIFGIYNSIYDFLRDELSLLF